MRNIVSMMGSQSGLGITFSPAGLLTPFHLGACYALSKNDLITKDTSFSGSSGGALAAVTAACYYQNSNAFQGLLKSCEYIANECIDYGTRETLREALDDVLEAVIPMDVTDRLQTDSSTTTIAYKQMLPFVQDKIINSYTSREDVIEVLRASCNIPFYFNGNNPFVKVRDGYGIDGYFAVKGNRFGCPETDKDYELFITPFSPKVIGLNPEGKNKDTKGLFESFWNRHDDSVSISTNVEENASSYHYDIISPDLLSKEEFPYEMSDLLSLALSPPTFKSINENRGLKNHIFNFRQLLKLNDMMEGYDDVDKEDVEAVEIYEKILNKKVVGMVYESLFDCGRKCVERWLEKNSNKEVVKRVVLTSMRR